IVTSEREVVERVLERKAVVVDNPRLRLDGKLAITVRDGHVIAISAYRCGLGLRVVLDAPVVFPTVITPDLAALGVLPRLERIDAGDNLLVELTDIPATVRELYIDSNQIRQLPRLPPLRLLDANRNALVELPPLPAAELVYAASNRLVSPPSMGACR